MVREMAAFTLTIAVGFFLAVVFYESLSSRDVLVARTDQFVSRLSRSRVVAGFAHLLVVVVCIPLLVALWAVVLEAALAVVGASDSVRVAESAVAVVAAARVLAYVHEKTSHELAKLIPLALVLPLLMGGVADLEENLVGIVDHPLRSDLTVQMIGYLIALEIGLRLVNDVVRALRGFGKRRRSPTHARGKVESSVD